MFEADATIAWVDENGMAQAQDYYLSNYVQVSLLMSYNNTIVTCKRMKLARLYLS